jgi:hypothetical protein
LAAGTALGIEEAQLSRRWSEEELPRFSAEVGDWAVPRLSKHRQEYPSQCEALVPIAVATGGKLDMPRQALSKRVRQHGHDIG